MKKQYFERKTVIEGDTFQIWERLAGGNWEKRVHHNEFYDQYGPYAWH